MADVRHLLYVYGDATSCSVLSMVNCSGEVELAKVEEISVWEERFETAKEEEIQTEGRNIRTAKREEKVVCCIQCIDVNRMPKDA